MTDNQKMKLWAVEDVSTVSPEMKIVRNIYTNRLMLKRVGDPGSYDMMRRLCSVRHVNLMSIYDCDIIGGYCVSLCEYIEGITLEQAVAAYGVYSEKEASRIVAAVCNGLTALHRQGIIHRDINPSNVMIDRSGCVKVIDYDIARTVKPEQAHDTTIMGTAGFVAPEQFGFRQTDERADVYSCGALLNFLLTGYEPGDMLYQGNLYPVIMRCIALDPQNRYFSAAHLRAVMTNDKSYLRQIKSYDVEEMRYRPIPGFRSKHIFPKILTVFGMILYFSTLILYIVLLVDPKTHSHHETRYYITHVFLIVILYGFWTLFPYLLFGDVGKYTLKLTRDYPMRRRLKKLFGWLSILLGVVLFIIMLSLYNNGVLIT
ncbi:MAG: serine/threonine protein kinase [Ruminococcus sp.]|nr:serine/threonine protein kinase [Ruminococcus sp.]